MSEAKSSIGPLKIFLHAMDGVGHMNGCAGLGQALAARGHQVSMLINESFAGQYEQFGLTEVLLKAPAPSMEQHGNDQPVNMLKMMAELMQLSGYLSSKSPLEKLKAQCEDKTDSWAAMIPNMVAFDEQIEQLIEQQQPDVILLDTAIVPPAIQKAHLPWIRVLSAHPFFGFQNNQLPPAGSGYATHSDPSTWKEYRDISDKFFGKMMDTYGEKLFKARNFTPKEQNSKFFFPISPYLNIYGYPEELDYQDVIDIPNNFMRVDAFIRKETGKHFELPNDFAQPGVKLIYLSLGSMGSIDVQLMNKIVSILGKTAHKCIVSKGQRADEIELPVNCWGEAYLPQTKLLPLVDLVITHGGNNTITETFACGKPMIVMPLFADQYDNAQRVQEQGYGLRLEPYSFTEEQLLSAIQQLLDDSQMQQKLDKAKDRMTKSNSKQNACKRIEEVVAQFKQENNHN